MHRHRLSHPLWADTITERVCASPRRRPFRFGRLGDPMHQILGRRKLTSSTLAFTLVLAALGSLSTAHAAVVGSNDSHCTVIGTSGDDKLVGTDDDDVICGLGGHDIVNAGKGSDHIYGGGSYDFIHGGAADDYAYGGPGNDSLDGKRGFDRYQGGRGNDHLWAKRGGFDSVNGGYGRDCAGVDHEDAIFSVSIDCEYRA